MANQYGMNKLDTGMNLAVKKTVADATSETCKMLVSTCRMPISKKAVSAVPVDGVMVQSLSQPS